MYYSLVKKWQLVCVSQSLPNKDALWVVLKMKVLMSKLNEALFYHICFLLNETSSWFAFGTGSSALVPPSAISLQYFTDDTTCWKTGTAQERSLSEGTVSFTFPSTEVYCLLRLPSPACNWGKEDLGPWSVLVSQRNVRKFGERMKSRAI